MERSTIANDAIEKCIVFSNKNLYMYIHWNLWLRKKVILKQFQTYPLSIVYEFRSLLETRIYLLSWSFPRFTYENLGNSLKKCYTTRVHQRGASVSNFSSWSRLIEKQFIVTREIGTFGEGNVRKITRPISTQDAAPEGVQAGRLHAFATFSRIEWRASLIHEGI